MCKLNECDCETFAVAGREAVIAMPEFDVRLARVLYADVTIMANDVDEAIRIAGSASYQLPPMSQWHVASGGEIIVRDEDSRGATRGSWSIARIIPDDQEEDEPHVSIRPRLVAATADIAKVVQLAPTVTELAPHEFTIRHGTDGTERAVLHTWPGWKLEEEVEFIVPAPACLGKDGERVLVISSDEQEYEARIEDANAARGTWIVLE